MEISDKWQEFIKKQQDHIRQSGVDLVDPTQLKADYKVLTLVFKIDDDSAKKIDAYLKAAIPENIKDSLILQPYQGYHFTIQWTPDNATPNLVADISKILSQTPAFDGNLVFPFAGHAGFMATLQPNLEPRFKKLREELESVWSDHNLKLGLAQANYEIIYSSLSRYKSQFSVQEAIDIPLQSIPGIVFNEAQLVMADKFMNPENSDIIANIPLGK